MSSLKNKKKVLILVLSSRNYLSKISSVAQQSIWKSYMSDYKIIHFVGNYNQENRELNYIDAGSDKYLSIDTDDKYENIALKTFLAFKEIYIKYEFDYIFRTNTSSFIDFNNFEKYIDNNSEKLSFSGIKLKVNEGDEIASGAGIFLSRKNIKLILDNEKKFDFSLPDDVAIARLLKSFNIHPENSTRRDLKQIPSPSQIYNSTDFHYRCRLDPAYHRILEPQLMKYLNRATKGSGIKVYLNYFLLNLVFFLSNLKFIFKIIQKFYSFKFYGELQIGNQLIYNKNLISRLKK